MLRELLEHILDALEHLGELILVRERRDPEVIPVRRVEARAGGDEDMLLLEQLERKRLVVETGEQASVDADERIHRAAGRDEIHEAAQIGRASCREGV